MTRADLIDGLAFALAARGVTASTEIGAGPTDLIVTALDGTRILAAFGFNVEAGWEAVTETDDGEQEPLRDHDPATESVVDWLVALATDPQSHRV